MKNHYHWMWRVVAGIGVVVMWSSMAVPVQADMGPKPSMEFSFVYETTSPLTIVSGEQVECADAVCADDVPLERAGPQRFTCTETACSSMAYSYADYHRLVIKFSDGVTRESNVFEKSHFDSAYHVTVRTNDLLVEETGGRINPMLLTVVGSLLGALLGGAWLMAMLVVLVWLLLKAGKDTATFAASKGLFIAAWVVLVPLYVVGGVFSLTLPLTLILEGIVAAFYATIKKHAPMTLVTLVALVNLITQPFLWSVIATRTGGGTWRGYIVLEALIVLMEAGLLYALRRKSQTFQESLVLSLWLNGVSLVVGLVLPA